MSLKDRYRLGRFPSAPKGMGEVWPAKDTLLDRAVIVKFVNGAIMDPDLVRRFRREALLTARLDHPGVPAVYDLGEHDGQPYLVLQRIDGITLTDLIAEHDPLPIEWVAAIGAQVSSILLAAAQIGLVHRDIKPSNIMLETTGAVKVLDFGLAVVHADDRYSRITQTGQSLGTVGYMAPEQVVGEQADHRTDLYGLGATLFDLITGCPPFGDVTTTTVLRQQMHSPPPRPSHLRPEIPTVLDDLIHGLLAIDPQDRPATAADAYAVLAPLSQDLPPLPGVLTDTVTAVQAYSAIVGRVPQQPRPPVGPIGAQAAPTAEPTMERADQLYASRQYRAAAREWRRLADALERQQGEGSAVVFDLRVRAARAHVALGEHPRARRQLEALLRQRAQLGGPEDQAVRDLRQEIARLSTGREGSGEHPRSTSGAGR